MSASSKLTVYIQTRGFANPIAGKALPETSLLIGVTKVPPNDSIYDTVAKWSKDYKLRKGIMIEGSGSIGGGVGGYIFMPGKSHNLDNCETVDSKINDICRYLNNPPGLAPVLTEMIHQDIFARKRHQGIWEILLITEEPPGQMAPTGHLFDRSGPSTCRFKMVAIRIQRNRETFPDRVFTRRGVGFDWQKIEGTYDPTNDNHNVIEKMLDF